MATRKTPDAGAGLTTSELTARLRRHYLKPGDALPGGVFLTEVMAPGARPGEVGWESANRRLDALYIGFTSARGRMLEGHEVKVSRSDWMVELAQAHKADWWFEHTHRWWVVAADRSIVEEGELPEGWGLMVPNSRTRTRLDVVVKATVREPLVDFGLLLEIAKKLDVVRREGERHAKFNLDQLVREGVRKGIEQTSDRDRDRVLYQAEQLRESVAEFEKESGVRIATYRAGNIGEAVRRVLAGEQTERQHIAALENLATSAERIAGATRKEIANLGEKKN
jgi:hypothetical protein